MAVTDPGWTNQVDDDDPVVPRVPLSIRQSSGALVEPPAGFSLNGLAIPRIQRLGSGRFFASLDVQSMRPKGGVTYYVHPLQANGTANSGLTAAAPTSLGDAIAKPDVGTIVLAPGEYYRTIVTTSTAKSINYLASGPGVRVTGWNSPGSTTWTLHTGSIYKTTRSATTGVVDVTNKTAWGDYTVYTKKTDAASITGPGQWALVGSDVYVWAIGNTNLTVDANRYQIRLAVTAQTGIWHTDGVAYVRGIDFEGFAAGSGLTVSGNALILADDCTFKYGQGTNGVNVNNGRGTILRRCEASSNELDGFNYHGTGAVEPDFIEIDCKAHHNGILGGTTNNASTAHEQVRGIRVNGEYDVNGGTNGPVVADVNEARSWNLGCHAGKSLTNDGSWRADGTGYAAPAQMWLDECLASGVKAYRTTGASAIHIHACKATGYTDISDVEAGSTVDFYQP